MNQGSLPLLKLSVLCLNALGTYSTITVRMPILAAGFWDENSQKSSRRPGCCTRGIVRLAELFREFFFSKIMPLFSPAVAAARVAADKEERHPLLASCSRLQSKGTVSSSFRLMVYEEEEGEEVVVVVADLEEDGLAVAAGGAADGLGAGQRGVAGDVLEHLGELAGAVVHHVPVHAVVVGDLLRKAGPAEHFKPRQSGI